MLFALLPLCLVGCGAQEEHHAAASACSTLAECASDCDELGIVRRESFPGEAFGAGGVRLRVAFALLLPHTASDTTAGDGRAWLQGLTPPTAAVLDQCNIGLDVVRHEVWSVPAERLALTVTRPTSWAGAAPSGVGDADAFNHAQDDRLPDDVRQLLETLRGGLDEGAVLVVVARDLSYFSAGQEHGAGGASLPPVIFHQAGDFPARNAVFAATISEGCDALPVPPTSRLVAHELGHMLLDTGSHDSDPDNLMSDLRGPELGAEQCALARDNVERLFGAAPVVDPGPSG